MINDNISTVIITLITVAGSAGAWKFYESKLKLRYKLSEHNTKENVLFREDLRDRVNNLEKKLTELGFEIFATNKFGWFCTDIEQMGIMHAKR